jgi:hypothetical protein
MLSAGCLRLRSFSRNEGSVIISDPCALQIVLTIVDDHTALCALYERKYFIFSELNGEQRRNQEKPMYLVTRIAAIIILIKIH